MHRPGGHGMPLPYRISELSSRLPGRFLFRGRAAVHTSDCPGLRMGGGGETKDAKAFGHLPPAVFHSQTFAPMPPPPPKTNVADIRPGYTVRVSWLGLGYTEMVMVSDATITTRPTGDLWRHAVDRGHGGATTRRSSPAAR